MHGRTRVDAARTRLDGRSTRSAADARTGRRIPQATPPAVPQERPGRRTRSRVVLSALVMTFAAGLVATLALPSYAYDPTRVGNNDDVAGRTVAATGEQQYRAGQDVAAAELARDTFKATSTATLLRRAYAAQFSAYTGPSAADFLKNPGHPPFSLGGVYGTALQYQGVPYVFGGADPSGFDCSGFIMFVYAQYGVNLPHSVHAQDAIGTRISQQDAQPGDVVVFDDDSHDGFYAGNGMILHAPYPGARVRVQKLWSSSIHFVRFGI